MRLIQCKMFTHNQEIIVDDTEMFMRDVHNELLECKKLGLRVNAAMLKFAQTKAEMQGYASNMRVSDCATHIMTLF